MKNIFQENQGCKIKQKIWNKITKLLKIISICPFANEVYLLEYLIHLLYGSIIWVFN